MDRTHNLDKYKNTPKTKIYNVIHDRACKFYDMFKMLPKFIPVTLEEYHQIEMAKGALCLCHASKETKDKRKICYQIGNSKMLFVIMEEVADGMDIPKPDSTEAMKMIGGMN